MFIIDEKTNKITLTRGDTATMLMEIKDLNDNVYDIKSTDLLKLTVRQSSDSPVVLTLLGTIDHYFVIYPNQTSSLNTGLYVYDVLLTTQSGEVYTVVPTTFFELLDEVSI